MSDKKAFIFDTNFIIQNKHLDKVVENLKDEYNIYVTQVSIDERIAQRCREIKEKYDEVERCIKENSSIATIRFEITYEEYCQTIENALQNNYNVLFGNRIIPYDIGGDTLGIILKRANKKEPPFSSAKNASDKGFKDCLLWLSLLEYFKTNGETEVVFVSEDGGFKDNSDYLCDEFGKITGKNIVIKPNSYYNELLESEKEEPIKKSEPLPDFSKIREQIEEVMDTLRWEVDEDYFGNENWYKTFVLQKEVDSKYMEIVFSGLKSTINDHIFECSIPAFKVLDLDGRLVEDKGIPMKKVENALHLYEDILKKYPDYIEQFYNATAIIINRSYNPPIHTYEDIDEDLPF